MLLPRTTPRSRGTNPRVERLVGRLGALDFTALILDALRDSGIQVLEQGKGIARTAADETSCPVLQSLGWIRVLRDRQCSEVGPFVGGIMERVGDRRSGDGKNRPISRVERDIHHVIDNEHIGHGRERGHSDCITEDVMCPFRHPHRRYRRVLRCEAKVATFAWTKHQAVWRKTHQPAETIGSFVLNSKRNQQELQYPRLRAVRDRLGDLGARRTCNCGTQAHIAVMAKSPIRLLDVAVSQSGQGRWKWNVSDGTTEIAAGFETTREAAQTQGDSALFALLSINRQ